MGLAEDLAADYCWIHGSPAIPAQYQAHLRCIADQEEQHDTSFYQWVTFMMAAQAALFVLPHKLWQMAEGGLVATFGQDGRKAVIVEAEDGYDDGVLLETIIERYVKYFKSILHHNAWYLTWFLVCETLNLVLLAAQLTLTDIFLNGRFGWYGWEVVEYYSGPAVERRSPAAGLRNPVNILNSVRLCIFRWEYKMCAVFPTEVSCSIPAVGAAGEAQLHNGLCVLTQNIINEKIYLVLWFWFAFLVPFSGLSLVYRALTLFLPSLRFGLIYKTVKSIFLFDYEKGCVSER